MPKNHLYIFDMHATLVNSDDPMLDSIREVINENTKKSLKNTEELEHYVKNFDYTIPEILVKSKRDVLRKILGDEVYNDDHFKQYDSLCEKKLLEAIDQNPDTIIPTQLGETVQKLNKKGGKLGMISNSSTEFLNTVLGKLRISEYFDKNAVIGSDIAEKDSTGDAIIRVLEQTKAQENTKLYFIGDAPGDAACLKGANEQRSGLNGKFIHMQLPKAKVQYSKEYIDTMNPAYRCQGFASLNAQLSKEAAPLQKGGIPN